MHEGREVRFYAILDWIGGKDAHASPELLRALGLNFVRSVEDLPEGAGAYISGYDADVAEVAELRRRGVPIVDHACPWIRRLREQIQATPPTHQAVVMLDDGADGREPHVVYRCYRTIFPPGTIFIDAESFAAKLAAGRDGRPLRLMVYATFRPAEAERVVEHVRREYPHPDHQLGLHGETLCYWTKKQGLLAEIVRVVPERRLDEVWILCLKTGDRSTMSIVSQVAEAGARPRLITAVGDIPEELPADVRVGVLVTPMPTAGLVRVLAQTIADRFGAVRGA